jgi:hypothetical protein
MTFLVPCRLCFENTRLRTYIYNIYIYSRYMYSLLLRAHCLRFAVSCYTQAMLISSSDVAPMIRSFPVLNYSCDWRHQPSGLWNHSYNKDAQAHRCLWYWCFRGERYRFCIVSTTSLSNAARTSKQKL